MKLVSTELPPREEGDDAVPSLAGESDRPRYPYGTELRLDADLVAKLKISEIDRDGKVTGTFEGYVSRYEETRDKEGDDGCSMSIQITGIAIAGDKDAEAEEKRTKRTAELSGPTK